MRKSFLPVLLIAVLLLGACSSVQAPAAPTVAPTLAPTPAPTPEPTPDPTPSPSPTLDLLALYNPYRLDYLGEDLGPADLDDFKFICGHKYRLFAFLYNSESLACSSCLNGYRHTSVVIIRIIKSSKLN